MGETNSGQQRATLGMRDDALLANIALLYYNEGLTQGEIAKRAGVSRATIVNYLREGRERGIVSIRIRGQALAQSRHSRDLCAQFGLSDAYIAAVLDEFTAQDSLKQTARVAAEAFFDIIEPGDKIGVAWGDTIKLVSQEMPRNGLAGVSVFQLIGSMRSTQLRTAESCAIQIASRLDADCFTLHSPAVMSTEVLAEQIRLEPSIHEQLVQLKDFGACIYSVGDLSDTTRLVESGIVTVDDLHEAVETGAAGILCGRFIDADGQHLRLAFEKRMIAVELEEMRRAQKRMLVASGLNKLAAVKAALKGGYVTHLIVDSTLASALLG
ncbi:MAG: sugar-binding transcriptional regulator [Alphaproteobacteria bacterium]|nr:sugar-binding transcriptional regulator [Alphaproteobacteria bacterium]